MKPLNPKQDNRIPQYIQAAEELGRGNFRIKIAGSPADDVGRLGQALQNLAKNLEARYQELQKLNKLTSHINSGLLLEEILSQVYLDFHDFIPYDRIGFALLEDGNRILTAKWTRTEYPDIKLGGGYQGWMQGSSLEKIISTGKPRIINNLSNYLQEHPQSESTRLILSEGVNSSLTCPLIANGVPVGFMFFSSKANDTYADQHVEIYQQIAGQLSVIVEKGRLVSELAQQKSRIEQQNQEMRRLMDMQNKFMGMAAHDLRNPIASIQSVADLLLMTEIPLDEEEKTEFLQDIHNHTEHMLGLLNDLLDVTHIESGKFKMDLIFQELSILLVDAVKRNVRLAKTKGTRVELEGVPTGEVLADPNRIRQVMDNLISNAVKYSPPGSLVLVRAIKGENCWRVEVQDEGPGINQKDRDRLFQDFARLSAKPTGGEKSVGLGLSITRRVIEAHGGSIGVDSEPGNGSVFWFTLPFDMDNIGNCD